MNRPHRSRPPTATAARSLAIATILAALVPVAATAADEDTSAADEAVTAGSADPLPTITVRVGDEGAITLAPVEVRGGADDLASLPLSTGLDGAAHTQPLSLVSYSIDELMALGARDQKEALETVAGVIAPLDYQIQPQGGYSLRGFDAYLLRDGFATLGSYGDRDTLVGIERIDFIKGPGSSLNSGALGLPPGGAIDLHSHWAGERRELFAGYGVSRYGQQEVALDADSGDLLPVVSASLAYGRGDGGGFYDGARLDHEKIRPGLSLRTGRARLSFYYERSTRTQKDYPGLPTTGTLDRRTFTIPDARSVMDPDVPLSHSRVDSAGFDGIWPLADWLEMTVAGRRADSSIDQAAQYVSRNTPDYAPLAPSTFQRLSGTYDGQTRETQGRARLTLRNPGLETLGGVDVGRWLAWIGYGGQQGPDRVELRSGLAAPIDLADPRYTQWSAPPIEFADSRSDFRIRNLVAGLQWRYGGWLNAFAATTSTRARIDNHQTTLDPLGILEPLTPELAATLQPLLDTLRQNPLLQNAGLSVDRRDRYDLDALQYGLALRLWTAFSDLPEDGLWAFAGRGEGHQFRAYFTSAQAPLPELSSQREAGLRLVHGDWGRIEAAHFEIRRRNVPAIDPNDPTGLNQVTTGLQSVRGYDLEARINPPYAFWDRFTLAASAAWLDSRLDEDTTYAVGNRLPGVPRRRTRVQFAADLLRGTVTLRSFAVQRCQSAVEGDLGNSFSVPGRCLYDAGAGLGWRGLSLDLVLNNLADRHYYEPYTYLFYGVIPGEARNLRATLSYRFRA